MYYMYICKYVWIYTYILCMCEYIHIYINHSLRIVKHALGCLQVYIHICLHIYEQMFIISLSYHTECLLVYTSILCMYTQLCKNMCAYTYINIYTHHSYPSSCTSSPLMFAYVVYIYEYVHLYPWTHISSAHSHCNIAHTATYPHPHCNRSSLTLQHISHCNTSHTATYTHSHSKKKIPITPLMTPTSFFSFFCHALKCSKVPLMSARQVKTHEQEKEKKERASLTYTMIRHVVPLMSAKKVGENEWGENEWGEKGKKKKRASRTHTKPCSTLDDCKKGGGKWVGKKCKKTDVLYWYCNIWLP